jgi:hypothetical protein
VAGRVKRKNACPDRARCLCAYHAMHRRVPADYVCANCGDSICSTCTHDVAHCCPCSIGLAVMRGPDEYGAAIARVEAIGSHAPFTLPTPPPAPARRTKKKATKKRGKKRNPLDGEWEIQRSQHPEDVRRYVERAMATGHHVAAAFFLEGQGLVEEAVDLLADGGYWIEWATTIWRHGLQQTTRRSLSKIERYGGDQYSFDADARFTDHGFLYKFKPPIKHFRDEIDGFAGHYEHACLIAVNYKPPGVYELLDWETGHGRHRGEEGYGVFQLDTSWGDCWREFFSRYGTHYWSSYHEREADLAFLLDVQKLLGWPVRRQDDIEHAEQPVCSICEGEHEEEDCDYTCDICHQEGRHKEDDCDYECDFCRQEGRRVGRDVDRHHEDDHECATCRETGHSYESCDYQCDRCGYNHHEDDCEATECDNCGRYVNSDYGDDHDPCPGPPCLFCKEKEENGDTLIHEDDVDHERDDCKEQCNYCSQPGHNKWKCPQRRRP